MDINQIPPRLSPYLLLTSASQSQAALLHLIRSMNAGIKVRNKSLAEMN